MDKAEIRTRMKALRHALTSEEITKRSAVICDALFSVDEFNKANTVMVYLSAFKEVDTAVIIERLKEQGKRIVVPVSNTDTCTITPSYIDGEPIKGAYGILEPAEVKEASVEDIDVIIVPGVAFDRQCSRCGFGKGYYDRLLSESKAFKIGLCYDFQVVDRLETDEHDVPMDMVITDVRKF